MEYISDIKNERILFILKETYSYPIWFLLPYFEKYNKIALFFINHAESGYKECYFNRYTYYKFSELKSVDIYDLNIEADEFTKCFKEPICDMNYLNHIERNICTYKNLNLQAVSSQQLSRYYHNRIYFKNYNFCQRLKWIELNYKGVERILNTYNPTLILDTDTFEFPRTVLIELAKYRRIPYISIDYPRYEDYKIPTYSIGYGMENYFQIIYDKIINNLSEDFSKESEYIEKFRKKNSIMSQEFQGTETAKYTADNLKIIAKRLLGKAIYLWNQNIMAGNYRLIQSNPLIYPSSHELIKFFIHVERRKRKLYGTNKYFKVPHKNDEYVYFPLHLIPEASTVIKAPYYVNELHIIESVSKALPIGWKLYVKEHQSMLGERDINFYKKVNLLPNCQMVCLDYYKDPKPWIVNSKGVITITGTSAYEAVLLGKRAIVFGDVSFSLIEGIQRVTSFEELNHAIQLFDEPIDNVKSCAAYIKAVKEVGYRIDIRYLMREGERLLSLGLDPSKEFIEQIDALIQLYNSAYKRIKTSS